MKYWSIAISLIALISACSSGEEEPGKEYEKPGEAIPITLSCGIGSAGKARATDYGYETNDRIGLFVVNYNGGKPGALQTAGNHVDNMRFTYDGTWTPDSPIYWQDDETKADFYCYYPYAEVNDVAAHPFAVKEDQSADDAYKASEFLYGKTSGVSPTASAVSITTYHVMSCAVIEVHPGAGFTQESLEASQVSVKINNARTQATVNLKTGAVTASGEAASIVPLKTDGKLTYKALVVPQTITADNFITVTVDGREFKLKKEATFVSGKRYTIPVTVSKTSNGINVGVGDWEDDDIDYGGVAE